MCFGGWNERFESQGQPKQKMCERQWVGVMWCSDVGQFIYMCVVLAAIKLSWVAHGVVGGWVGGRVGGLGRGHKDEIFCAARECCSLAGARVCGERGDGGLVSVPSFKSKLLTVHDETIFRRGTFLWQEYSNSTAGGRPCGETPFPVCNMILRGSRRLMRQR